MLWLKLTIFRIGMLTDRYSRREGRRVKMMNIFGIGVINRNTVRLL